MRSMLGSIRNEGWGGAGRALENPQTCSSIWVVKSGVFREDIKRKIGMAAAMKKCWICGDVATTGEHKSKRSDLRDVFGAPTQAAPLFYHDGRVKNRRVGSLDAKVLKSPARLCANCNNSRTQPYDFAWENLSGALRTRRPALAAGMSVRANSIFPYDTARCMRDVHLYFVKLFGCHIEALDMALDIKGFSEAILNDTPHPNVYLKFGVNKGSVTGSSDVWLSVPPAGASSSFATWYYWVDKLAVNVMFARDSEKRQGLLGAWHPRYGTNKVVLADFDFGSGSTRKLSRAST